MYALPYEISDMKLLNTGERGGTPELYLIRYQRDLPQVFYIGLVCRCPIVSGRLKVPVLDKL